MPRTSKRQRVQRTGEYFLAAGLSILFLLLLWAVWGIAQKEEIARNAVDERRTELAILQERKAIFEDNLAELSTERGQEATLRQNHGVARTGEEVIIVVPSKENELDPHIPWHKRLMGWFGIW